MSKKVKYSRKSSIPEYKKFGRKMAATTVLRYLASIVHVLNVESKKRGWIKGAPIKKRLQAQNRSRKSKISKRWRT